MPYSQPADIRNVLAPGFDWNNPPDPVPVTHTAADLPDSQLVVAVKQADQLIDGYLAARYVTPVAGDPPPEPVPTWSTNIAAYLATLTWRKSKDLSNQDPVVLRLQLTLNTLAAVASGKQTVPLPTQTGDTAVVGVGRAVNSYYGNLFGPSDFDLRPSRLPGEHWPWQQNVWGEPLDQLPAQMVGWILEGMGA